MKLIYHILIAPILRIFVILLTFLCFAVVMVYTCAWACCYPFANIVYWIFTSNSFDFDYGIEDFFDMVLNSMGNLLDKIKEYGK